MDTFSDDAITSETQDRFNLQGFISELHSLVSAIDSANGAVVGVEGAWGSGKTSALNLLRGRISASNDFISLTAINPWMFSDARSLVSSLLADFSKQVHLDSGSTHRKVLDLIENMMLVLEPVGMVSGLPGAALSVNRVIRGARRLVARERTLEEIKTDLNRVFEKSGKILVFVDDLDRLQPLESIEVLKFLRLVANFKNVTYVVAFSSGVVVPALNSVTHGLGREYLEKIFTTTITVPPVDHSELVALMGSQFESSDELDGLDFRASLLLSRLIKTPRDAKRLAFSVEQVSNALKRRVRLTDLIQIEAIRLKAPSTFEHLITGSLDGGRSSSIDAFRWAVTAEDRKAALQKWRKEAPDKFIDFDGLLRDLFPGTWEELGGASHTKADKERWLGQRRLGAGVNWRFYLSRLESEEHSLFDIASTLALDATLSELALEAIPDEKKRAAIEVFAANLPDMSEEEKLALLIKVASLWGEVPRPTLPSTLGAHVASLKYVAGAIAEQQFLEDDRDWTNWCDSIMASDLSFSSKHILLEVVGEGRNLEDARDVEKEQLARTVLIAEGLKKADSSAIQNEWAFGHVALDLVRKVPEARTMFTKDLEATKLAKLFSTFPVWSEVRVGWAYKNVVEVLGEDAKEAYFKAFPDELDLVAD